MRRPVTDIALLAYIAKKNAKVLSYTEATKACKSSSSASRALHQLIGEGILEPKPKLLGLRYVTQYMVTQKGKQVADLALQLAELREAASKMNSSQVKTVDTGEKSKNKPTVAFAGKNKIPPRKKRGIKSIDKDSKSALSDEAPLS
jgi:hypothetical protein